MAQNTEKRDVAPETKEVDCPPGENCGPNDFNTRPDLDGKTDSGPEPDVHGRELPPQK
jgi:hypothetical protein